MLTSPDCLNSDVINSDANAGGSFHARHELIYQPAGRGMLETTSKNKSVWFPNDEQLDLSTQDATQPKTKGQATVKI